MVETFMSAQSAIRSHWCEVLGVDEALPEDSFFELGGHSLLAVELIQRIETDLDIAIPADVLFQEGTLAALLDAAASAHSASQ
ncbi:acyl carrier protein [Streptomyces violaceorubidus]|uniref:acyl carrier protein n=1 Tax=Streptomyces violaceorubidus TaxID=284042 RepID=UPI0012FEDE83|nr:acyl carrier protein [Streptomyces violaceorubidus]